MQGSAQGEARHLRNIRQLTFDGWRNTDARFSPDGRLLAFQSVRGDSPAAQVFVMDADGRNTRLVSTGTGLAVCPSFAPDRPAILFAGAPVAESQADGRPQPWNPGMDVFETDLDGTNTVQLTHQPGYDGEASYSPDGQKVVFSSTSNGDVDLYVMDREVQPHAITRLAATKGQDGSAFFSPSGEQVVFRSFHAPSGTSELYLVNADGTGLKQLTGLGMLAWSPFFHPDGRRVIFSANLETNAVTAGTNHDVYLLDLNTGSITRITFEDGFDGLPAFSPDGKRLVWTSARQGGALQVFLADWQD